MKNNEEANSHPLKLRSARNKTLTLSSEEENALHKELFYLPSKEESEKILLSSELKNRILTTDLFEALPFLPRAFADLIIIDPPYNLAKNFHGQVFKESSNEQYTKYVESWLPPLLSCAKKTASIYICCDWKSSNAIFSVLEKHAFIRNRITWQREKGRGSRTNWKNCSEDIWYATMSDDFYFNPEEVKQRKKVIAPYREKGQPKDWIDSTDGKFRFTYPSNFWDDITIPYWSMSENTEHPTQKSEKLLAKLILASSKKGDLVFDPFAGSGSTLVTAKKLNRAFFGIEHNKTYCLWAHKRIKQASLDSRIQGYEKDLNTDIGFFTDRNS